MILSVSHDKEKHHSEKIGRKAFAGILLLVTWWAQLFSVLLFSDQSRKY